MKFAKPAISIDDQLALLRRRGMVIADEAAARHYLQHISYYRLRAYWLPFEGPAPAADDHAFKPNTTFEDGRGDARGRQAVFAQHTCDAGSPADACGTRKRVAAPCGGLDHKLSAVDPVQMGFPADWQARAAWRVVA